MSGIGAISPSTAIRIIRPVQQSAGSNNSRRDDTFGARQAYATAGARTNRSQQRGDYAPFLAQSFANDNRPFASSAQGSIAYLIARDRMTDLPIGFLIAKAV